jgi:hypothetical protein
MDNDFECGIVKALLEWFKTWFSWVNSVHCDSCDIDTEVQGMVSPTEEDIKVGARRVELHVCPRCGKQYRFPRIKYNLSDIATLLHYCRQGEVVVVNGRMHLVYCFA